MNEKKVLADKLAEGKAHEMINSVRTHLSAKNFAGNGLELQQTVEQFLVSQKLQKIDVKCREWPKDKIIDIFVSFSFDGNIVESPGKITWPMRRMHD